MHALGGAQKRRLIFKRMAHVRHKGDEAARRVRRQIEKLQRLCARQTRRRCDALDVHAVVDRHDLARRDTRRDQLLAHRFGVGNNCVRQIVGASFSPELRRRFCAGRFAARGDAHGHAGERSRRHAKDVRVKVERLH